METHGFIKESNGFYSIARTVSSDDILDAAREILARRLKQGTTLTGPNASREYLISQLAHLEHEVFFVIFMDNKHRIIASGTASTGTIDSASVYFLNVSSTLTQPY